MQIHEIKPKKSTKKRSRIGRGGKRGTYAGRGMKGQKARAGTRKMKPAIEEVIKKYPKLRGYKFSPLSEVYVVNVAALSKVFESGEEVTPKTMKEKGLVGKGKKTKVKILGEGDIDKPLKIKGCSLSRNAREKIEKAGGECENNKEQ